MPTKYCIPTTLWSSEYLKYLARPPAATASSSAVRDGRPVIILNRSLNTPSPASQPTVPSRYPRTMAMSFWPEFITWT